MSTNIPFAAVERLFNVDSLVLGKVKTKSVSGSVSEFDSEPCPIITPQPTPNLLLDHATVEASRIKLENVWSTIDNFPSTDNQRVRCLYCNIRFMEFIETPEATRWFIPLRQEKKEDLFLEETPECSDEEDNSSNSDDSGEDDEDEDRSLALKDITPISRSCQTYYVYSGEGIYCSYFCSHMQLTTRKMSSENMKRQLKLLDLMYKDWYGVKPQVITTPVTKDHIEEYGGYISKFAYKVHAFKYEGK